MKGLESYSDTFCKMAAYYDNELKLAGECFMDNTGMFSSFNGQDAIRVSDAVIEEINRNGNTTFVTIAYNECAKCGGAERVVRLVVSGNTVIRDERGRNIRIRELERGMVADVVFSAAMTRSIPPQAQAFSIRVKSRPNMNETTVGRIVEVNPRESFIITAGSLNPASQIRFNVSQDTAILDASGRRIRLSMLIPGMKVRVEHANFMTLSIPPQTPAYVIQIIR